MSDPGESPSDEDRGPVDDEVTEDEIETNALEGRELDKLLLETSFDGNSPMDDPETEQLTGEETERLLRLSREPLVPSLRSDEAHGDMMAAYGVGSREELWAITDDSTVEREPVVTQAAIATLPMPKDPSGTPPPVPLARLAPPVAVPRFPPAPPPPSVPEAPPARPPSAPEDPPAQPQSAIATLPMPKDPSGTPPPVPLAQLAPPVAVPVFPPTSREATPPRAAPLPSQPPPAAVLSPLPSQPPPAAALSPLPSQPPPPNGLRSPLPSPPPPSAMSSPFPAPPAAAVPTPLPPPSPVTGIVVAQPPGVPRPPLLSAELPWRPQRRSPLGKVLLIAASGAIVAGVLLTLATHETEAPPVRPAAPVLEPPAPAAPAPRVESPAPDVRADAARSALGQLRDGLRECVRRSSMVLPGHSPPVPPTLRQTGGAGYVPGPNDWKTPVWSCATFRVEPPMSFQLQWQLTKGSSEGLAIAWLDDDGDGRADRAFGFRATLRTRGQVETGDVAIMDPAHPVVPVSY